MQSFRFIGAMVSLQKQEAILQEVKGLMNKLYAYTLVRKKTGLHANFQSLVLWLVCFDIIVANFSTGYPAQLCARLTTPPILRATPTN